MAQERRADRALIDSVEHSLTRTGLLAPDTHLVLGVSGGADSMCLLDVMARITKRRSIRLTVAHLDHGLRDADAAADTAAVTELASAHSLSIITERRSVPDYQSAYPQTSSVEEAARAVRYGFFYDVLERTNAAAVLTGHTADDQAETVLLHLVRGSGLAGLVGMSEDTMIDGLRVVRPLLGVSRVQTRNYCRRNSIAYRDDPTNESLNFARNRLRLKVLPQLRRLNPGVSNALVRLSNVVRAEEDMWDILIEQVWRKLATLTANKVALDLNQLSAQPLALQRRLVRRAIETIAGTTRQLEHEHIESALRLVDTGPGKRVHLPLGFVASTDYSTLIFTRSLHRPAPVTHTPVRLQAPGITDWGGWRIEARLIERGELPLSASAWEAYLDASVIVESGLTVRSRKPGDRIQPLGLGAERKLQDILMDAKVPRPLRDIVPVVTDGAGIVWVAGFRLSERAKITPATRDVLHLTVIPVTTETQSLLRARG